MTIKNAPVRFYIDADLLGLAKILVQVRTDVTYPGFAGDVMHKKRRPPCPVTRQAALDTDWLPKVCAENWLIITRDWHINDHRREIDAVLDNRARMITLSGKDARTKFDQLEVVMCRWREIESKLIEPGPFIYQATRTRINPVEIGDGRG